MVLSVSPFTLAEIFLVFPQPVASICLQSLLILYSLYYQILGSFQYIKCSTVMPVSKKNVVST